MGKNITIEGHTYIEFLIPGLAAMASMTQAFAIGSEINIARFYWHIFEEFQAAPISNIAYVIGEVLAGMTRALLAGLVILILGALFGVVLSYNGWLWLAFMLNAFVFASLAVGLAMIVKSHADQAMMTSFVITPMAFPGRHILPARASAGLGAEDFDFTAPAPCRGCHPLGGLSAGRRNCRII